MICEIICVGTELLMGQVVNTNGAYIARGLSRLGINVYHQTVVGDNEERLEEAYRTALGRSDIVITSGGLGPTVDDITKRVAARVVGKELVMRPDALDLVQGWFISHHRVMTENNLSQAMFTDNTRLIENLWGTAPGAVVPAGGGKVIIHLPGPPCELEPMFATKVVTVLEELCGSNSHFFSKYIRIFGMGESNVDYLLRDMEEMSDPTLSPYCSTGEVVLRLTTRCNDNTEGEEKLRPYISEISRRLNKDKPVIYAIENDDTGSLAKTCVERLKNAGMTISTVESLTGGMIASSLVNISGASDVLRAGMVTYQTDTKTILAHVNPKTIADCGVVSGEVAEEMANGARNVLSTTIAVSATGVAGPTGGTESTPVGTAYIGIASPRGVRSLRLDLGRGTRERIRTLTTKHALRQVIEEVTILGGKQ